MPSPSDASKYRAAIDVLQKGRDVLVEAMTDEILDQGEQFAEGGFLFQEFLETQGTRLHFLQTGWAQDPDWDQGYAYFREEWLELSLPRLQYRFTHGPIDWNNPPGKQQLKSLAQ